MDEAIAGAPTLSRRLRSSSRPWTVARTRAEMACCSSSTAAAALALSAISRALAAPSLPQHAAVGCQADQKARISRSGSRLTLARQKMTHPAEMILRPPSQPLHRLPFWAFRRSLRQGDRREENLKVAWPCWRLRPSRTQRAPSESLPAMQPSRISATSTVPGIRFRHSLILCITRQNGPGSEPQHYLTLLRQRLLPGIPPDGEIRSFGSRRKTLGVERGFIRIVLWS
jgi:hypothetical protein